MIRADLHTHTYYSDGTQSPADVVSAAKEVGLGIISVTDHDNCNGSAEVAALAESAGIISVQGQEISAYDGDVKVHILCYNVDIKSRIYRDFYSKITHGAEERTADILKKLKAGGIDISMEEVLQNRKCEKSPLHVMYIAAAGAKRGYTATDGEFYMKYLSYGRIGFSCICRPTPEETVNVAVACGGFCSLAHPGRISLGKEGVISLLKRTVDCGLRGIEAVYSGHTDVQTQYYKELAQKYSLLVTGGSDTHCTVGSRRVGYPEFYPSEELLSALKIK